MLVVLQKATFAMFAVVAIAYLVQLARLCARVRRDEDLWKRLGEPSLFTLSGQRSFDRVLFRPTQVGISDPALLRDANRTKLLLFAALVCFVLAVTAFFFAKSAMGA